jgi:hypothetical protein
MRWIKSLDEGMENGTVHYRVMRSDTISGPFVEIANMSATGQSIYNYTDVGKGDGDTNDYFYFIQSVNENMNVVNSRLAGKMAIGLSAGWQLISFPFVQERSSVEAILRTLDFRSVRCYDSQNDSWRAYHTFKNYSDLKQLDNTMGFWVEVTRSDHLVLAGLVPPRITEIHLYEGWNLVSFPSFLGSYSVGHVRFETRAERVEGFDSLASPYLLRVMDDSEEMVPFHGYWIKVPRDVTWTVPNILR